MHTAQHTIYGIKNCDTVRKACSWLDAHDVPYAFVDTRQTTQDLDTLMQWFTHGTGADLINTRSTGYRQLSDTEKLAIKDVLTLSNKTALNPAEQTKVLAVLMLAQSNFTLLKRPILVSEDDFIEIGFKAERYNNLFTNP